MMNILRFIKLAPKLFRASPVESIILGLLLLVLAYIALPLRAVQATNTPEANERALALKISAMQNETLSYGQLPEADLRGPFYTVSVQASAYTSRPEETDDTPFITASGSHVRVGVLATNFLPMGTRVKIPSLFGDQVFVVEDRMNKRYYKNVDIWMADLSEARQFGRRQVTIEVYPNK